MCRLILYTPTVVHGLHASSFLMDDKQGRAFTTRLETDVDSVALAQFVQEHAEWRTVPEEVACTMCRPGSQVLFIESNGEHKRLVAVACAIPTDPPVVPGSTAFFLNNVIVEKSHRRRGLGKRIVVELIEHCANTQG